jgi:CO/xanthine dehydrogenase FAD-binding subunit
LLLALNAAVELAGAAGRRSLPIQEFVVGNRATLRRPDELVTGISIPKPGAGAASTFVKLGARRYLVISIVSAAVLIEPLGGEVAGARAAVGACAPVPRRLPALEAALRGRPLDRTLADALDQEELHQALSPIDDVRGSAGYRREAAGVALRRALSALAERLGPPS